MSKPGEAQGPEGASASDCGGRHVDAGHWHFP